MYIKPTSYAEVHKVITKLKNEKSTGIDETNVRIIESFRNILNKPITDLFNKSVREGAFPELFKTAKVIPIHKGGSATQLNNYRPIALLTTLNKIFEKLMYVRLFNYFNHHNLFYSKQLGFRTKRSTIDALRELTESIRAPPKGKEHLSVFLDFRKAFDTLNHEILLNKLERYGIRGPAPHWLNTYLKGRRQYVSIGEHNSEIKGISHGVPQGSVLGPLLFLIYINDIHRPLKHATPYLFADDTNLLFQVNKGSNIEIAEDGKHIASWLQVNRLSLNLDKTAIISFARKPKERYDFGDKTLHTTSSTKYQVSTLTKILL